MERSASSKSASLRWPFEIRGEAEGSTAFGAARGLGGFGVDGIGVAVVLVEVWNSTLCRELRGVPTVTVRFICPEAPLLCDLVEEVMFIGTEARTGLGLNGFILANFAFSVSKKRLVSVCLTNFMVNHSVGVHPAV